ncbi:MAG: DNA primase [Deltaproteobacteria bacterium]|nr:DNA primase [Deltaproteobacteria bacterium]
MKGHIPREKIEEIKDRANIVDIISEYVTLKKAGRNFVGLCPFHREKAPSFTVNQEKQIFYCFGCQEGGNLFSFLMKINSMSFAEAVRHMAGKLGIRIPQEVNGRRGEATEREKINRINRMAAEFFSQNLSSPAAKIARKYLAKRGMADSVIEKFRLGYSQDGWRYLKDFFESKKVPLNLVEKAGLIISKDSGQFYDRFRGRLMFPIEDVNGAVIAFGGRELGNGEPKYLNSPESPVYTKGNNLYGLSLTKDDIRKKDYVIIVEGYFDLLALWGAGITNVVATLGTALTRRQIGLIGRFTRNVIAIFDPDEGGKHAVERSLPLFLEEEIHVKVGMLPEGNDPADYVIKHGEKGIADITSRAMSMVDYYIEEVMAKRGYLEDNIDSVGKSLSFISHISDPIQRNLFIKRVSEKIGIDQSLLKTETGKVLARSQHVSLQSARREEKTMARPDKVEMALVHLLLLYPEKISMFKDDGFLEYFTDQEIKGLVGTLMESFKNGVTRKSADLVGDMEDCPLKNSMLKLLIEPSPFDDAVANRALADTVQKLRDNWYRERRKALQRKLIKAQEEGDQGLKNRLLLETKQLLQEEKISNARNN